MNFKRMRLDNLDIRITHWMAKNGILLLRLAIGIIFIWFGAQKFFKEMSPAELLAAKTICKICVDAVSDIFIQNSIAVFEVLIGIGLIFRLYLRFTLLLLFIHMLGTFTPLFLYPEEVFVKFPFFLTLEGQYIIKNIVILAEGIVIGATVRGGGLKSEPNNNNHFSH